MQPTDRQSTPSTPVCIWVAHWMPWLLALLLWLSVGLLQVEAADRSIGVAPGGQPDSVPITGEYWAVLIGIDEYAYAPNLESAVKDVQAVRAVLEARYGFHPSRIKQLLNAQATRKNIENTLYALSREAGPEDSVFIYYAGHGQYDQARDHGWWVPTDGEPRQAGTLITNATILRYIKGMQARHVYLVADSCFSGSLFGTRALPPITDRWYAELYKDRSRWGLTSGATEPVADRGLGGHSPFAYFLLKLLRENTQPYLVPSTIHESLAPLVANNTNQVPRSEPLTQSGDEGGQFVFRLAETPSESPTPPVVDLTPYQQLQQQTEYKTELEKAWSIVKKFATTPGFTTEQRIEALKQFERDFPTANPHRNEIQRLLRQVQTEGNEAPLLQRALKHLKQEKYQQAIADLNEAIRINPQDAMAYTLRGSTKFALGRYEEAVADHNDAIRINPQYDRAYAGRGIAKFRLSRYEQAIADYNEAIHINPQNDETYARRGTAKFHIGRYEQAIEDLNEAIRINPQKAMAYVLRGIAKVLLEKYEEAIADSNEAIRMNPQSAEAYALRGVANTLLRKYEEALADLNEAIRINPQNAMAYALRGSAKSKLSRDEEAIADSNEAIRLNPRTADAYWVRGMANREIGEYEKARADLQQALQLATEQDNQVLAQAARRSLDELPPASGAD